MPQYSFAMKNLGTFGDDWESTLQTGDNEYNKIQAVKYTADDVIFITDPDDPDKLRLRIYAANGSYKTSGAIQVTTALQPYDYFENECPDGAAWDGDNIGSFQCAGVNLAETKVASFKSERVPTPIGAITSAGVRVWARFDSETDILMIDKMQKVINVA